VRAARCLAVGAEAHWKVRSRAASRHVVELSAAGLTQRQIAERAGVSTQTVHRLATRPSGRAWNTITDAVLAVRPD
jgi:transposase